MQRKNCHSQLGLNTFEGKNITTSEPDTQQ